MQQKSGNDIIPCTGASSLKTDSSLFPRTPIFESRGTVFIEHWHEATSRASTWPSPDKEASRLALASWLSFIVILSVCEEQDFTSYDFFFFWLSDAGESETKDASERIVSDPIFMPSTSHWVVKLDGKDVVQAWGWRYGLFIMLLFCTAVCEKNTQDRRLVDLATTKTKCTK